MSNCPLRVVYRAVTKVERILEKNRSTRKAKPDEECLFFLEILTMRRSINVKSHLEMDEIFD